MMKTSRAFSYAVAPAIALALAAPACTSTTSDPGAQASASSGAAPSAATLPVKPQFSINHMMVAQIDHAAHAIWDAATDETPPKTDEDWREVQHHAIQVASAGPAIALGGNGQADPGFVKLVGWTGYAQKMTDAGVAAFRATEKKDRAALSAAGDDLIASCEGCHKEFKPTLPSEGYLHPHNDAVPK